MCGFVLCLPAFLFEVDILGERPEKMDNRVNSPEEHSGLINALEWTGRGINLQLIRTITESFLV